MKSSYDPIPTGNPVLIPPMDSIRFAEFMKKLREGMFKDPYWQNIAEQVKQEHGCYPPWWQTMIDNDKNKR